jgi:hypothetical protein
MKSPILFSRKHNGPISIASVVVGFVIQLVLITQLLYSCSFGGTGLISSTVTTARAATTSSANNQIPYRLLASVVQGKLSQKKEDDTYDDELPTILELTKTLSNLASHQQTFKGLDGVAHEAYQRTHSSDDVADTSVSGRAQRSAARLAAVAEALYACELVEIAEHPELSLSDGDSDGNANGNANGNGNDGRLQKREIILNVTLGAESAMKETTDLSLSVLVIYEPLYSGGVGLEHGNLLSLTKSPSISESENGKMRKCKGGRLLVVLGHKPSLRTTQRVEMLDTTPQKIKLSSGLVTNEVASVQPELYKKAGELLALIEPQLRQYNTSSVHFVGHSLAGGVASLAATILDGSIPMPKKRMKRKPSRKKKRNNKESDTVETTIGEEDPGNLSKSNSSGEGTEENHDDQEEVVVPLEPLNGLGRARSSATTLGSPPCLSSNVLAAFCTSFIYGDDIICRTTEDSVSRLLGRVERTMHSGFIGKKLGWMSDTMSLTVSSLQSHAHGSEGEETRLAIPGRAFLVRPRRLGGICSIHEVGNLKKGGREALREALLWQMNDVLLSTSMWKHHDLKSYIHGLDRTQLRGVADDESDIYLQ